MRLLQRFKYALWAWIGGVMCGLGLVMAMIGLAWQGVAAFAVGLAAAFGLAALGVFEVGS